MKTCRAFLLLPAALSRANPQTRSLPAQYHLLQLIGGSRLHPANRHALAAFRQEAGQANP